jgi:UDP-glucose 4-epimerase
MVVPRFIQAALTNDDIVIYDDGSQSRVFCHVEDAVKAVLSLVDSNLTIGDYFNVGGTGEITIKQLAEKVIDRTHATSKIKFIPYTDAYPGGFEDMQRRVPDITKITQTIGWVPSHSLDSIIDSVASSLKN